MNLKIATWNMDYWKKKNLHQEMWDFYTHEVDADIYLFQEGRPNDVLDTSENHLVWSCIEGQRNWGSGIYSPKYELSSELINTSFKGAFTIANASVGKSQLTLISMYGLMENSGPTKGYAITNLHRMLSDLTALFYGKIKGKRKIILGGI